MEQTCVCRTFVYKNTRHYRLSDVILNLVCSRSYTVLKEKKAKQKITRVTFYNPILSAILVIDAIHQLFWKFHIHRPILHFIETP